MVHKLLIVVCVPARNEEKNIASVLVRAKMYADKVIVCDDGSTDLTGKISEAMGVEVLRNESPNGYGAALGVLFRRAAELHADVTVTLDADGQHEPAEIPSLADPILKGEADLVIASRFLNGGETRSMQAYRRAGISTITGLTRAASGLQLTDAQSGFRAYSRAAVQKIAPVELGMGASVEILMRAAEEGLRIREVSTATRRERQARNPVYQGVDVIASILKFISIRHPLLSYGALGIMIIIIGFVYGSYTIQIYAAQSKAVTNVALLSQAIVTSGLLLVFMAIILFTINNAIKESN